MRPALLVALVLILFAPTVADAQEQRPAGADSAEPSDTPPSSTPVQPSDVIETNFNWRGAARQSFYFLTIQHSFRLTQGKTRRELGGPFFADWGRSIRGIRSWRDGDGMFTNYVAHPMQGGVAGYIQIHNDPRGRYLEFGKSPEYWKSRLRATAWSAAYSTNFELGMFSESSFGNVGMRRGTAGYVDLVMTPAGGMGMLVAEDWLDRHVVKKLEARTTSAGKRRIFRVLFNPTRGVANVLAGRAPWHRDTRNLLD